MANHAIPGIKEAKGVVYIVMVSDAHSDDVATVFFSLEDAKEFCGDCPTYHIVESNVF